eukprot:gene24382-biopygen23888
MGAPPRCISASAASDFGRDSQHKNPLCPHGPRRAPGRAGGGERPPPVFLAVRPGWPARPGRSGVRTRHAWYTGSPCTCW